MKQSLLALASTLLLAALLNAQVATSQTLPAPYVSPQGTIALGNAQLSNLVSQFGDQREQWHYSASAFQHQGPLSISEIYVHPRTPTGSWTFPSWTVTMGTAATNYPNHHPQFSQNWSGNQAIVRSGPWSGSAASSWVPLGLTAPFVYDPTQGDLIIEIKKCGGPFATIPWSQALAAQAGPAGQNGGNRYTNSTPGQGCTASFSNCPGNGCGNPGIPAAIIEAVPIIKLDYTMLGAPEWMVNQPGSTLTVDGTPDPGPGSPLSFQLPQSGPASLMLTSTAAGQPWDLLVTSPAPGIPFSVQGISTPGGQVVNVDLLAPSLFALQSLAFNGAFTSLSVQFQLPPASFVAGQMINIDPGSADGFSLSHLNEIASPQPPQITVEAIGSNVNGFNSIVPFWQVHHLGQGAAAIQSVTFDLGGSSNIALAGTFFDTDHNHQGAPPTVRAFINGNASTPFCQGTYHNNSHATTGLVFAGTGPPLCGAITTFQRGWTTTGFIGFPFDWHVRDFTFTFTAFSGQKTFAFNCGMDFAPFPANGAGVSGTRVTLLLADGTVFAGELSADPANSQRSFITFP